MYVVSWSLCNFLSSAHLIWNRPPGSSYFRYAESSMKNSFGLKYLHKFFNIPFLQLQVRVRDLHGAEWVGRTTLSTGTNVGILFFWWPAFQLLKESRQIIAFRRVLLTKVTGHFVSHNCNVSLLVKCVLFITYLSISLSMYKGSKGLYRAMYRMCRNKSVHCSVNRPTSQNGI